MYNRRQTFSIGLGVTKSPELLKLSSHCRRARCTPGTTSLGVNLVAFSPPCASRSTFTSISPRDTSGCAITAVPTLPGAFYRSVSCPQPEHRASCICDLHQYRYRGVQSPLPPAAIRSWRNPSVLSTSRCSLAVWLEPHTELDISPIPPHLPVWAESITDVLSAHWS